MLILYAKRLGFSLGEIRNLLTGFDDAIPAGERWSQLAAAKLEELDAVAQRLAGMRAGLQRIAQCRCADLEQCAHAIAVKTCS